MKILILSFYYPPDLCAGSFRTSALVKALLEKLPDDAHVEVITTLPNRYSSFSSEAPELEQSDRLTVRRIKLPVHKSGMVDQAKAYFSYAYHVLKAVRGEEFNLVYGTSSRLMTAALSAFIARSKHVPLYLDIRDIFVDTIKDVLPAKAALLLKPCFSLVERWTVSRADHVNLVSEGFAAYFKDRYPQKGYSFFTNGIDSEFLDAGTHIHVGGKESPLTVLYAGNMGEGQGLHAIVPELAKRFSSKLSFRLLGDGGRKIQLEQRLAELGCDNVVLLPPVGRQQLIEEYLKADILFLHLNNYDAFLKVLPSKIFEYAAMGKPIWAGIAGYSAEFMKREVPNAAVFEPCNVEAAVEAFDSLDLVVTDRTDFKNSFSRVNIMRQMAGNILGYLKKKN